MAVDIIARGLGTNAQKSADEANQRLDNLPKPLVYRGAVNYYDDLPTDAAEGDVYTVKYEGSSGTTPSGKEYAWGYYEGTLQWIELTADIKWGEIGGTLSNQVDIQNALDNKLDKLTGTSTYAKAYIKKTDGTQGSIDATDTNTANTLILRDANNNSNIGTPTSNTHIANKKYVDDGLSTKQDTISDLETIRSDAAAGASKVSCTDENVGALGYTKNTGTITGITMNGQSKGTSGVVDLGTVITSHQDISGKVTANTAITGATKTKITYDSKGLVTNGEDLQASDIPNLDASKITSGTFADARIASAETWNGKQPEHITTSVALPSASWVGTSITISVSGVTASNTIIVSPSPASVNDWASAKVYCSAQANGTLTFTCSSAPSVDLVANIMILN